MHDALWMLVVGAVVAGVGFALSKKAKNIDGSDGWDRAGATVKISGAFTMLLGLALFVPPTKNAVAVPMGQTHVLSSSEVGLQLKLPSSSTFESERDATGFKAVHQVTGASCGTPWQ